MVVVILSLFIHPFTVLSCPVDLIVVTDLILNALLIRIDYTLSGVAVFMHGTPSAVVSIVFSLLRRSFFPSLIPIQLFMWQFPANETLSNMLSSLKSTSLGSFQSWVESSLCVNRALCPFLLVDTWSAADPITRSRFRCSRRIMFFSFSDTIPIKLHLIIRLWDDTKNKQIEMPRYFKKSYLTLLPSSLKLLFHSFSSFVSSLPLFFQHSHHYNTSVFIHSTA